MSTVARSSASRSGFSQPSGVTAVPSSIREVRCERDDRQRRLVPGPWIRAVEQPDGEEAQLLQRHSRLRHAAFLRLDVKLTAPAPWLTAPGTGLTAGRARFASDSIHHVPMANDTYAIE